jgi:hypothetical protein
MNRGAVANKYRVTAEERAVVQFETRVGRPGKEVTAKNSGRWDARQHRIHELRIAALRSIVIDRNG